MSRSNLRLALAIIPAVAIVAPAAVAAEEAVRMDSPPQVVSRAAPQYPFEMRRAGVAGEVTLSFFVDVKGRPVKIAVVKSSRKEFEPAAIAAIEKWRFKPALKDGKPVEAQLQVPLYFTLGQKQPNQPPEH